MPIKLIWSEHYLRSKEVAELQLYLLRKNELRMTILPARVSGQYSVEYTTEGGNVMPLVRINARDDKWFIVENKSVQISGSYKVVRDGYGEFELKENSMFYLRKDNKENMILMIEPESANRKRYQLYKIPAGGMIDVGQAEYNQVQFLNQYINENRHLRICYNGELPECVKSCEEEVNSERNNPSYINNKKIEGEVPAKVGDVVFLFGMKIVLGKGFIAVNDPDGLSRVHLQKKDVDLFVPVALDEEQSEIFESFSSAPRERKEFVHRSFKIENPPEGLNEEETPWIVMLGPSLTMAMGSVFSSVITINNIVASSGSINSALPSLVTSIVMVLGSAVWPIVGRRVQHRSHVRRAVIASDDYEDYLKKLQTEIEAAVELQKDILKENNPLLTECINTILNESGNLWERSQRHKDFLDVMIGSGDVPLDADFSYPERGYHSEISQSAKDMYNLVAKQHVVKDVPISLPLKDAGIVGIVGDRSDVVSFTKALLVELTAMHNYEDLKIIFIYNEKEREIWEFVKWIPHLWNDERTVRYLANDPDEVKVLSDYISNLRSVQQHNSGKKNEGPYYLIFAADKTLAERAQAIKELYQSPEDYNMTMVALYDERQYLPKACSYVIDLIHDSERRRNPDKYKNVAATLADYNDITGNRIICKERIKLDENPEDIFIKMANIHLDSPTSSKQLPSQYTFMEMFEVGKPEHLDMLRRWRENSAVDTLAAPIGIDADGYYINLDVHEKAHGPHGVIAGMTGSGKSEFIISYIASLAINYSPEDVAFVLIDFKGGGMADIFKNLPHTAGLITNLDGNELRRSFLAIEHELEKRQKLFKEISEQKKISNIDIYKYQKLRREDKSLKALPHLILISDEFAELKQQHADFMGQLIRIARIGRSLGVHLILATQKPDGVVDDQIKSNIRFKVCLKVQDKSDSQGMIGRPDATLITNAGRFYFQVGNDEVFEYGQSPWSGALYEPMDHVQKNVCDYIEVLNEQGFVICRETVPKGKRPANVPEKQIDALVEFINEVATQNDLFAENLWLSPLEAPKDEKKKTTVYETDIIPFVLNPTIGKYDDLLEQNHLDLTVPFSTQGNALLYGASGSGKLEFVNRTLVSIMENHSPEEVQFFLCDYDSGSLAAFEDSAYTDTFVGAGDRTAVEEMLDGLVYEMIDRREQMRRFGGDFQTFIKSSAKKLPNILLVIHNFQNLSDTDPEARQKIIQIAREGTKYGLYLLMTGTSANSIPYSMQPLFKNVYTLRQNADDQYREIVGKTEGIVPEQYKGRGLVRANGTVCEFQTQLVFEDADNVYEAIQRFCMEIEAKWNKSKPNINLESSVTNTVVEECETTVQSSEAQVDLILDAEYRLDAVPVGVDEKNNIKTYDITGTTSTIIVYENARNNQKLSVVEAIKASLPPNGTVILLNADNENVSDKVDELWSEMQERGRQGVATKNAGLPIPDYDSILILVDNPSEITETADEITRVHLVSMITKLTPAYHMYFVISENQKNINSLIQGKCLGLLFPVADGMLFSTDKGVHVLFDDTVEFKTTARSPYGYIVQNKNVDVVKITERV